MFHSEVNLIKGKVHLRKWPLFLFRNTN